MTEPKDIVESADALRELVDTVTSKSRPIRDDEIDEWLLWAVKNLTDAASEITRLRAVASRYREALEKIAGWDWNLKGFSGDRHADCIEIASRALNQES